jgi:UDP-glucose 4-epimerase
MIQNQSVADLLKGKRVLITGGTGSLGKQILNDLLGYEPASIAVFSRDEKKQYDLGIEHKGDGIRMILGDVRNPERVREAVRGTDIVFHAAALKQVPNCEYAPLEAVRTNIEGAANVRRQAIEAGVEVMVSISTDKAVKPVNVMGMTKAIQERIMRQPENAESGTRFVCVRYGNVLGSRGSIVPLFFRCIERKEPLPITHPDMTRFQLTISQAVGLVFWAAAHGKQGELWVRKMPAAKVTDLGRVLAEGITGRKDYPQTIVGIRPGEKMHEVLVSVEEAARAQERDDESGGYFIIPAWDYESSVYGAGWKEYSSDSVHRLSDVELHALLDSDGWFKEGGKRVLS